MKHIWYILLYVFQFSNIRCRKLRNSNMSICILQWWDIYLIDLKASSTYVRGKVVYTCQNKIILLGIHKKYITFTAYLCAGLISFTQSIFASNSKIKVWLHYFSSTALIPSRNRYIRKAALQSCASSQTNKSHFSVTHQDYSRFFVILLPEIMN